MRFLGCILGLIISWINSFFCISECKKFGPYAHLFRRYNVAKPIFFHRIGFFAVYLRVIRSLGLREKNRYIKVNFPSHGLFSATFGSNIERFITGLFQKRSQGPQGCTTFFPVFRTSLGDWGICSKSKLITVLQDLLSFVGNS